MSSSSSSDPTDVSLLRLRLFSVITADSSVLSSPFTLDLVATSLIHPALDLGSWSPPSLAILVAHSHALAFYLTAIPSALPQPRAPELTKKHMRPDRTPRGLEGTLCPATTASCPLPAFQLLGRSWSREKMDPAHCIQRFSPKPLGPSHT